MTTNRLTQPYEATLTQRENGQLVLILTPFCGDAIILEETMLNKNVERIVQEYEDRETVLRPIPTPPTGGRGAETVDVAKYSRGPWRLDDSVGVVTDHMPRRTWGDKKQWSGPYIVCQPHLYVSPKHMSEEMKANAKLIAAAPELLDALKAIVKQIGADGELGRMASEAIEKAEL